MALRNKRWISWTILFLAIVISFVTKFISLSMYGVPPGADYGNYLSQVNILHGYDLRGLGLRYDPLYFILLDGFLRIFDPFTALKVAASLVFSIIAIPFFLFVRKLSNSFTASIGAWFLVFFEGYSEMIAWGGNPNFLGFSLMLLTFFSLIKTLEKPSKKNVILTGFFLSLIIGTHILVTIFTLFSFLIFIILTYIFKRKTDTWCLLKIILSSSLIAIVFSLPYFPVYMTLLRNCSNGLIRFNVHQLITMTGSLAWLFRTQYLIITIMIMLSGFALVKYYKENSRNNGLILTSLFLSPLILALTTENADRWLYFLPIPIIVCFCLYLKNLFTYIKGMKKEVLLFTFCCMLLICAEWSINSLNRLKTAVDFYQIIYKDERQALSWIKDNTPPNAKITSPASGDTISGTIDIQGVAWDTNFKQYRLEYSEETNPLSWTTITTKTTPVSGDVLASWKTMDVDNGNYVLKLTCEDKAGITSEYKVIVTIDNVNSNLTGLIVYPNPFRYSKHTKVIFRGLSRDAKIRIFTLSGELVREVDVRRQFSWSWDVKNDKGEDVARGIYIYLVTNPAGEKKIGKIAIIREK